MVTRVPRQAPRRFQGKGVAFVGYNTLSAGETVSPDRSRSLQIFSEAPAERQKASLPPNLVSGPVEEPDNIFMMVRPKIVIDQPRLMSQEKVPKPAELADAYRGTG